MNERILIILNKSEKEEIVNLELPEFYNLKEAKDLASSKEFEVKDNKISLDVNGLGYLIMKLDK
jgi:hypothetical protein